MVFKFRKRENSVLYKLRVLVEAYNTAFLPVGNRRFSLQEIEFDLNAIQLKGKVCEKMQCITSSGEFWTEFSSNHMSRLFSTEQDATDWFKFVITTLAKLPTVSYDKRLTKEYQKITLEKVLKENSLVIELLVLQNKKQVSVTLN